MIVLSSVHVFGLGYWAIGPVYSTWTAPLEETGPHNSPSKSCFSTPQEKMRILISSSYSPYGLVWSSQITTIHVYSPKARPWHFKDQSVLLFNFGNSLVPHVQRLDGNQTMGKLSWNTSGKSPAHNFYATINTLSNQFLFSFNIHIILDPVHWTCLFLSLSLSCASTNTKILSEDHFSHL